MMKLILTLVLLCYFPMIYSQEGFGLDRDFCAKPGLPSMNTSARLIEFNFFKVGKGYKDFYSLSPNSTDNLIPGLLPLTLVHSSSFFCQLEYKIEAKSKLAPRFRLGSLDYTNRMEGKSAWYTRYYD